MSKRIVLVGGSGMLGTQLSAHLQKLGFEIINVSRSGKSSAGARGVGYEHLASVVDGALAVVNLAGANIGERRWTNARRRELVDSRLQPTKAVVDAILACSTKPALISMSGISYYGNTTTPCNEGMGQGKGFLAQLSAAWEREARRAEGSTRVVLLRMAPVLEPTGGPLGKLMPVVKRYLGGVLGSGRQYMPWIHLQDAVRVIAWAIMNETTYGVYNVTAPQMITMSEFTHALGRVLHRPIWLRVPQPALYLLLGTMADTVDDSIAAYPMRLQGSSFTFSFPSIDAALSDLVGKNA